MVLYLKKILEDVEAFLGSIYQSILSLIKVLVLSKFAIKLPKAEKNDCYILGNGPSLNKVFKEKSDLLKSADLFCVNAFSNSEEYTEVRPQNCVYLDSLFFEKVNNRSLLKPHILEALDSLIEKTSWKLRLFIPVLSKGLSHIEEIPLKNPNIEICYFNYTVVKGFVFFRHFLFKKNLGMPLCQNVLGVCLCLALNRGYKNIFLIGADHNLGKNLYVDDNNELCMIHHHFYDQKPTITPVYKKSGGGERMNIAGFYTLCVKTFNAYYIIEEYAKYLNAKIYNATEGSFIDAFERKKI